MKEIELTNTTNNYLLELYKTKELLKEIKSYLEKDTNRILQFKKLGGKDTITYNENDIDKTIELLNLFLKDNMVNIVNCKGD